MVDKEIKDLVNLDKNQNEELREIERKDKFLLEMYKEQFKNVDRHVNLTWQTLSIVFLFGTLIVSTIKFEVDPIFVTILTIIAVTWNLAKLNDSEHWYERHIHIISNIECHFLGNEDKRLIHNYFDKIRDQSNSLDWITIQRIGLYIIGLLSILYYFFITYKDELRGKDEIFSELLSKVYNDNITVWMVIIVSFLCFVIKYHKEYNEIYLGELRKESPGKYREYDISKQRIEHSYVTLWRKIWGVIIYCKIEECPELKNKTSQN